MMVFCKTGEKKANRSWWVTIGFCLSLLYGGGIWASFYFDWPIAIDLPARTATQPFAINALNDLFGEALAPFWSFWPSEPFPINALGDFLAGAFAPLAFLWLFVATMIQSKELALQREELEDNRAVMEAQSAFIGQQTAVLIDERKDSTTKSMVETTLSVAAHFENPMSYKAQGTITMVRPWRPDRSAAPAAEFALVCEWIERTADQLLAVDFERPPEVVNSRRFANVANAIEPLTHFEHTEVWSDVFNKAGLDNVLSKSRAVAAKIEEAQP